MPSCTHRPDLITSRSTSHEFIVSPHCPHEVGRKKDRLGIVLQLWHLSHGIAAIEMFIETARRIAFLGASWQEEKKAWLQL